MSGYTDTFILEANRQQSINYKEENTSIWTNSVSNGIHLGVGDKISVESAFISDLGAENATIEFKGNVILDKQTFNISTIEKIPYVEDPDETGEEARKFNDNDKARKGFKEKITETTKTIHNVRDNQLNIQTCYYKNNNGEFVVNLPFHYILPKQETSIKTSPHTAWQLVRKNHTITEANNCGLTLAPTPSHILASDYLFDPDGELTQLIIDNSRYMIYGKPEVYYNWVNDGKEIDETSEIYRDIHHHQYVRIRDLIEMEVPTGFNSPTEVSDVITTQLQQNTELKYKTVDYDYNNTIINKFTSPYKETNSNKLFNCITWEDCKYSNAQKYYGIETVGGLVTDKLPKRDIGAVDYNCALQYIGIKRPDLYDYGWELNKLSLEPPNPNDFLFQYDGSGIQEIDDEGIGNYYRLAGGCVQRQIPIGENRREPNWLVNMTPIDDVTIKGNVNPYFTDFLQENPFKKWNEPTKLTPTDVNHTLTINAPDSINYIRIDVTPSTKLKFSPYDIIKVSCPTHPLSPTICKVTKIEDISPYVQQITFDGKTTSSPNTPLGTSFTFTLNANGNHIPLHYTVINTNYPWNKENLLKFKKFFDAQSKYPELFDVESSNSQSKYRKNYTGWEDEYNGEDISINTHRFLHLQSKLNKDMPKELAVNQEGSGVDTIRNVVNYEYTDTDDINVKTSFGYDNIPSVFSNHGTNLNTVNTASGGDYSSLPLFVKYFPEYKEYGVDMSDNEFNKEGWRDGSEINYDDLSVDGKGLWGGFALKTPASVCVSPKYNAETDSRSWNNIINGSDCEIVKSYKHKNILSKIIGIGIDYPTNSKHEESINDTISFIAQVPLDYLDTFSIYTKIDANGEYQPTATPTLRNIKSLYNIDYYKDWISKTIYVDNDPDNDVIQRKLTVETRRIGYDPHSYAYGNAYIGLYNGLAGLDGISFNGEYMCAIDKQPKLNSRTASAIAGVTSLMNSSQFMNKILIGADAPEFSFDDTRSRFSITSLHTAEKITAKYNATLVIVEGTGSASGQTQGQAVPVPDNLGKEVYKLNKIFDFRSFCPSITPYYTILPVDLFGTEKNDLFPLVYNNPHLKENSIFDSHSGIFFEDFAIPEKLWNNSFLGICGFKYNDLNTDKSGNINTRIIDYNLFNLSLITTNQNVLNANIGEWDGKFTGVANYKNQFAYPVLANLQNSSGTYVKTVDTKAPVEIESDSAKIQATNLPTKTLRPYFTIRTDLISDSNFTGGKNEPSLMPVIAILQKNQQYGDFFYGSSDLEFTNTYPRTITQITTQICDPSGLNANLSPNSCVLYKIRKQNNSNLNVYQDVLNANKKKKKK